MIDRKVLAVVAALAAGVLLAQPAASIDATALSDSNIARSKADIFAMKQDELRALLNYFAECSNRDRPTAVSAQACKSSLIKYQTEFGSGRPVDAAITAIEEMYEFKRIVRSTGVQTTSGPLEETDATLRGYVGTALKELRK
jgi:hypothetical protein